MQAWLTQVPWLVGTIGIGLEKICPAFPMHVGATSLPFVPPRGSLPWYVGKAERQSFRHECLTPHKVVHFNNALAGRKAKPELFFIPQVTPSGQYRSPTSSRRPAIRELESLLIGMAINRNPSLLNIAGTKWLQRLTVEGFLNTKKARSDAAKALRDLVGD